jgi:hypothetical protein
LFPQAATIPSTYGEIARNAYGERVTRGGNVHGNSYGSVHIERSWQLTSNRSHSLCKYATFATATSITTSITFANTYTHTTHPYLRTCVLAYLRHSQTRAHICIAVLNDALHCTILPVRGRLIGQPGMLSMGPRNAVSGVPNLVHFQKQRAPQRAGGARMRAGGWVGMGVGGHVLVLGH